MTVKINTTARIEKIRVQPQGAFPAGDPESGYGWLYFVTGSANGGMYFENDAGMRIGPFITGTNRTGQEIDYVEFTSNVTVSATSEATANLLVSGSSVAYDGSTIVMIEFWANNSRPPAVDGSSMTYWLYDGSSSIGQIGFTTIPTSGGNSVHTIINGRRRLTPSNATHVYSIRASVSSSSGLVGAGAGGNGNTSPGFIRIVRISP